MTRATILSGYVCLGASLFAGACATAGTAGPGSASASAAPNVQCPAGVVTALPDAAREGQKSLALQRYQEATTQLDAAVQANPSNPQLLYVTGEAYAGAGNYERADSLWKQAVAVCPAYEAEIAPDREQAWARVYQMGLDTLNAGDTTAAVAVWERAGTIYQGRPDAVFNLAVLSSQRGEYDQAAQRFGEALRILDAQAPDTSAAEMSSRADTRRNVMAGLLNVGAQRFKAADYRGAGDVFKQLTEIDPNSRDAWYNYALALYQQKQYSALAPVAQKVVQIDPLNANAQTLLYSAYREQDQKEQALQVLERIEELPVDVKDVKLRAENGRTVAMGTIEGKAAAAGTPVQLEFTFYGDGKTLGTQTVTFPAPAKDASGSFEVALQDPTPATSYSYRVVQ